MYRSLLILIPFICLETDAQYDIGISGGLYEPSFSNIDLDAPLGQWSACMFYRERTADRVDFAGELSLTSRTLSGELWPDVHASKVQVQFLNIAALAEVRLIKSGNIVIRVGPQAGLKLSESFTGSMRSVEQVPPYREIIEEHQVSRTYFFQNDHRIITGLGFRVPFGPYMALALDPYYTISLSKLFIGEYPGRANELGLRVGLSRRFHTTGVTHWLTRKVRRVPKEPTSSPGTPG